MPCRSHLALSPRRLHDRHRLLVPRSFYHSCCLVWILAVNLLDVTRSLILGRVHLRRRVFRCLCEAFQFQLLPDRQKVVQAVLLHLHLPVVDEVHHRYQICSLQSPQKQWLWMVIAQEISEKCARRRQDHLVCSYLLTILAGKSHIRELPCSSNLFVGVADVFLKLLPLEAKLLGTHHHSTPVASSWLRLLSLSVLDHLDLQAGWVV